MAGEEGEVGGGAGEATAAEDGFAGAADAGLASQCLGDAVFASCTGFAEFDLALQLVGDLAKGAELTLRLGGGGVAEAGAEARDVGATFFEALNALGDLEAPVLGAFQCEDILAGAALSSASAYAAGASRALDFLPQALK